MMRIPALNFRRGDLIAMLLVLILALAVFAAYIPRNHSGKNSVVQIVQDGRLIREYPLDAQVRLEVSGQYSNIVVISGGKASIEESDCPGEDCVHSGWISQPGRSIVCLPNRVEVRITGASDVDFVVG